MADEAVAAESPGLPAIPMVKLDHGLEEDKIPNPCVLWLAFSTMLASYPSRT